MVPHGSQVLRNGADSLGEVRMRVLHIGSGFAKMFWNFEPRCLWGNGGSN